MRMARFLTSALAAAPIAHLVAQQPALAPGARVRISAPEVSPGDRLIGSVIAVSADTILMRVEQPATWASDTAAIPYGSITRLDVSRGRKSAIVPGLLVGMGAGGIAGAALGATDLTRCRNDRDIGVGGCLIFEGLFVAGGGLVGAVLGAVIRRDRWEQVPPDRVRVGLAPGPGRAVTIAVAIRWGHD